MPETFHHACLELKLQYKSCFRFVRDGRNASKTNVAQLVLDIRTSRVDGFISFLNAVDKRYILDLTFIYIPKISAFFYSGISSRKLGANIGTKLST